MGSKRQFFLPGRKLDDDLNTAVEFVQYLSPFGDGGFNRLQFSQRVKLSLHQGAELEAAEIDQTELIYDSVKMLIGGFGRDL
jgi:hypothetical protein